MTKKQYEQPEVSVVALAVEQVIATSNQLGDYGNNPIYHEDF